MTKLILHPAAPANLDPRIAARQLYWQGWKISDIARRLGVKPPVVYSWKNRDNWDGGTPMMRVAASAETRLHMLVNRPHKSDADYKEMKNLFALMGGCQKRGADADDARACPAGARKPAALPDVSDGLDVPTIDNPPRERGRRREKKRALPASVNTMSLRRSRHRRRSGFSGSSCLIISGFGLRIRRVSAIC